MKMFLISDNVDTLTGMRLTGVEGAIARSREEFSLEIESVLNDKSIGVLVVTEKLAAQFSDIVNQVKSTYKLPLIVDIPDRYGTTKKNNFISEYVNEAIGL